MNLSFSICEHLSQLSFVNNSAGWMPVFDEDKAKPWDEKIFTRDETFGGKTIHVVGL